MTFANGRQQELRLLITKLHPSAPVILGFSWLRSTNPCINWRSLTLHLDQDNPTDSRLVPFDVSPSSKNSEATIDHPRTPPQLCSRSARPFIINVRLDDPSKVFPALVNSSASSTFVSNQLSLWHNNLNRPLKLQLFDGSPATTRITQYHNNTLTLNNNLQFLAWLLVTQLPPLTPIMLGLPWLQDVNPDINWKDLTMQFPSPKVSLVAAIPLHLQSIPDSDVSHPSTSTSRATQSPSTSNDNSNEEGDATPPQSPSITLRWLPPNIPRNQYKGPQCPNQQCSRSLTNSATTPDSSTTTLTSNSVNPRSLDIKIIGAIPFAHLLQDGTPAFQLQITPALPKEHLRTGTIMLESKTEEQILSEVVPPEYHEFADMFSEGSAKELPPHHSYDHKIELEEGTSPPFGKIYNMSEVEL
ncbi:hypothetical protein C0989_009372 [Termitomyces sp. Mn162]|nr:hypothetical protein C0989_009372 [Termitomyces sp. Mn162]